MAGRVEDLRNKGLGGVEPAGSIPVGRPTEPGIDSRAGRPASRRVDRVVAPIIGRTDGTTPADRRRLQHPGIVVARQGDGPGDQGIDPQQRRPVDPAQPGARPVEPGEPRRQDVTGPVGRPADVPMRGRPIDGPTENRTPQPLVAFRS